MAPPRGGLQVIRKVRASVISVGGDQVLDVLLLSHIVLNSIHAKKIPDFYDSFKYFFGAINLAPKRKSYV